MKNLIANWDASRPTSQCLYCNGTGQAPSSDKRTACGFCVKDTSTERR